MKASFKKFSSSKQVSFKPAETIDQNPVTKQHPVQKAPTIKVHSDEQPRDEVMNSEETPRGIGVTIQGEIKSAGKPMPQRLSSDNSLMIPSKDKDRGAMTRFLNEKTKNSVKVLYDGP